MSPDSAGLAKKMGYNNVKVFIGGIPAWKKSGKALVTNHASLKALIEEQEKTPGQTPSFILIDLRPEADVAKGFMPFAVAMSPAKVIEEISNLPKFKKARIVLYAQDKVTPEALQVLQKLYEAKYQIPAVLDGGFDGWQKAGNKVASGKPAEKIAYSRKGPQDEVPVAEFMEIVSKRPADKVVFDVREEEEFKAGSIPGAVNIPLEKLQKDQSSLPKDKEIIIFCNTGTISCLADQVLRQKGFKTRYLNATISYPDGKFKIEE
jgi:rhodanese-related sulfurtransferase